MPWARERLFDRTFGRIEIKATVKDLSLGWFSPVSVEGFQLQTDDTGRDAIAVQKIDSDASLLQLLLRRDLGRFVIDQPELFVEFDKEGNNLSRLLKALGGSSWGNWGAKLEISNGRLLLQGPSSPQPWKIDGLNLNVAMTPASDSAENVPVLHGENARFLRDAPLTPQMCNDIIKFVVPSLANVAQTSGRVSIDFEQFNWPLGKPNAVTLKGQLTLHSVESAPGEMIKSLAEIFRFANLPPSVQIAKDDVVEFRMHDGRVEHENLVLTIPMLEQTFLIRSHGSVGLDETLDLSIELTLPPDADLTAHPTLALLRQTHPTIHFGGTLNAPVPSLENTPTAAFQVLADFFQRRAERREQQARPSLLPGRREKDPPQNAPPSRGSK